MRLTVLRLLETDAYQPFRDGETQALRAQRLAQGHLTLAEGSDVEIPVPTASPLPGQAL